MKEYEEPTADEILADIARIKGKINSLEDPRSWIEIAKAHKDKHWLAHSKDWMLKQELKKLAALDE